MSTQKTTQKPGAAADKPAQTYDLLEVTFHARCTRAPIAYDGFGTLELCNKLQDNDGKTVRLVLIRDEHLTWQEGRYSSGLGCFAFAPADIYIDEGDITDALWAKISGKEAR